MRLFGRFGAPGWAAAALTLVLTPTTPLAAQDGVAILTTACANGDSGAIPRCGDAVLGSLSLGLGSGLLLGGGGVAGIGPNTLGHRLSGGRPRVGWSLRVLGTSLETVRPEGVGAAAEGVRDVAWGVRTGLSAGLFDGFRPLPSVGGLFSLDVFGALDRLAIGSSAVREGVWGWSGGVRVGLLRESFTAPGVAIDLGIADAGQAVLMDGSGSARSSVDVRNRSVRLSVGKDLLGIGLVAGVGRDWTNIDVALSLADAAPASGVLAPVRDVAFLGGTLNLLVLQLAAEAGWAEGAPPQAVQSALLDPTHARAFVSLAARVVF